MKQTQTQKPNKDKTVGVLVDAALYQWIKTAAAKENRSVSQWIRLMLERAQGTKTA